MTSEELRRSEYGPTLIAYRELPDGREVILHRVIYTWRISIGQQRSRYLEDAWCYEIFEHARSAFHAWDPLIEREPVGWSQHPESGRRQSPSSAEVKFAWSMVS
jgi:hypothetical protein